MQECENCGLLGAVLVNNEAYLCPEDERDECDDLAAALY